MNLTESHVKNELDILLRTNKPVLEQNDVGGNSPAAFLDLTNSQSPTGVFRIPPGVISKCLEACRGRKNLAGRLAKQLFTEEERKESNCRGVLGKKPLDYIRVSAIKNTCLKEYPMCQGETKESVERSVRTAIDEACRRKVKAEPNCEN